MRGNNSDANLVQSASLVRRRIAEGHEKETRATNAVETTTAPDLIHPAEHPRKEPIPTTDAQEQTTTAPEKRADRTRAQRQKGTR